MIIWRDPTIKDFENFFKKMNIVVSDSKNFDNIINANYDAWEEYCEKWSIDPEGDLQ